MSLRRALIPLTLALVLLMQFLPGTSLGPKPVAAALCDSASFVADVTIPDGTTVAPNAAFVKTWRLQNAGTCTWTTSYAVVFTGGDQMGSPAVIPMPASVAPGGTVDITVNLTAPGTPGHYRGNYKLKNATGSLFGVGANAAFLFWVDINVGTTLTNAFDFIAQAGSATWSSGAGTLPFPGTDGDVKGFVLSAANPTLENGSTSTTAGLIVNPQQVSGGYIQGVYPAFTVQAGDRFQSIVNCAFNATKCYVNFRLAYKIGSGPVQTLWTFNERYEGLFFRANVDLSSLAGQTVNFILYVADVPGHGTPSGDRAEWVNTMIARGGGGGTPIPPPSVCDRGAFVGDVTIPDGSVLAPGQAFTKTWRVRNVGSCTWTSSYSLVFVLGDTFGAAPITGFSPATVSVLPVAPGQTADFSLNMVAPTVPGHYRSYWRFRNASGAQFGVGSGMVTFFADINVSTTAPTPGGPTPTSSPTAIITGPNADLSVSVNDSLTTYTPGGTVTYTIVVSNNGPSNVTGATFLNTKPSPHVTSWTWTCTPDAGATCITGPTTSSVDIMDIVNIPAGKKIVYTVVANISASAVGNLIDTASITNPAAVPDPNLSNNSATDTDMPPSTDLSITMTDNVTMYTLGGTIQYTIQMVNAGPLPVTGATFSDPKPVQITSWNWVCTTTGGAVWSGPGSTTGNVTATVNMPVGSTVTCNVTATISSASTGNLVNTATITSPIAVPDAVPANNTASTTAIGPSADLAVTKTDGVTFYTPSVPAIPPNPAIDSKLTYTIVVMNNGPLTVNGATFTDNIPAQFTGWTWTCLPDTGAICNTTGSGPLPVATAISDNTVSIPPGNKVVYTVVATISTTATGNIINTATIQNPATIPDLVPANNSATDTDTPASADLAVTKTDGVTYYPPGGTVTYTIDVTNNGPQPVAGATFQDVKPTQVTTWVWTCVAGTGAICNAGPLNSNTTVTDTLTIPVGAKVRYTVVATIDPALTGDMVNTAEAHVPTTMTDPNTLNDTATDTDLHPIADLSVAISDQVNTYTPGGTTNYTIVVTNNGPSNVINATLTGTFPTIGAVLTDWTWTCVPQIGASCSATGLPLVGNFSDPTLSIPAGRSVTYTVVARIPTTATGPLQVGVSVTAPLAVPDPNIVNNSAADIDTQ